MGLIAQAQTDSTNILADNAGWAVDVTWVTPDGVSPVVTKVIPGLAIKHNTQLNEYGVPISGRVARLTVTKAALVAAGFPLTNLQYCVVSFLDAAGNTYTGLTREVNPDDTTGVIRFQLGDKT